MNGMILFSFIVINLKNVCLNNYGCLVIKMFIILRNVNLNREW